MTDDSVGDRAMTTETAPDVKTVPVTDFKVALDAKIPEGPIEQQWDTAKFKAKLVNPANKRRYTVLVVGSGLAGAAAAASFGELGYKVECFSYHDSPRRAHSI